MLVRKAVAAPLLVALMGLLAVAACQDGGEEGAPSPAPTTEAQIRQRLEQFSTSDLLSQAFPGIAFRGVSPGGDPAAHILDEEPTWRVEALGRLIGHFTRRSQPQLGAFVYLRGPEESGEGESRSRLLGLPEGVFVAFVELDSQGQPALVGWSFLDASGAQLLDFATAVEGSARPFRQGERDSGSGTSVSPALAIDTDNDGLDEMVLLETGTEDSIESARHPTFVWSGSGLSWQRLASPEEGGPDLPTQVVLDYLAAVHAATGTAAHWEDLDRALVLGWLSDDDDTVPDELLEALMEDAPAAAATSIRRELEATRELFRDAFDLWSPARQENQPWPDFINGFRTATGVVVEEMSAPSQKDERAVVQVVVAASSREGPDLVERRFRVTYELSQEEEGWRLDSADAREERGPE